MVGGLVVGGRWAVEHLLVGQLSVVGRWWVGGGPVGGSVVGGLLVVGGFVIHQTLIVLWIKWTGIVKVKH